METLYHGCQAECLSFTLSLRQPNVTFVTARGPFRRVRALFAPKRSRAARPAPVCRRSEHGSPREGRGGGTRLQMATVLGTNVLAFLQVWRTALIVLLNGTLVVVVLVWTILRALDGDLPQWVP